MLSIFVNRIRWIFHGFTCKVRELLYATSYIHNYSNMNKYFGSCWLHNGIVANAFCSLVKCIKRNVIIGFFIYIILVQIFKKFVYYDAIMRMRNTMFIRYFKECNNQSTSNLVLISIAYNDA